MSEQNLHGQPASTVNVYAVPAAGNGLATASLVLGILAMVTVWIPLFGMIAWILAPLGLVFGLVALGKPNGRGVAIAGSVCSALGLIGCFAWVALIGLSATVA
ncbi:hypothetical protein [Brevundimonas variabilis]|uniref:DUF4190 domain-containing protein n=1 Tax=Brevundimonas variabilis TaxID=74312 RepID=A0A7W9CK00_9CAUL|nr:hypothetical protein [Brevundimonas variabilis]MBB5746612.1 hypothetical protein [Brevundimonas variabilis]